MLIDNTPEYTNIWNQVYEKLKFSPSCIYRGHSMNVPLPFQIPEIYAVYGIDSMTDSQIDLLSLKMPEILISVTESGQKIYALDWQHSAFLFDPRKSEEMKSFRKEDERYADGGYSVYFPAFLPDGDYYFFIGQNFQFGYLGHPWRQEVWIFGEKLLTEIEKVYPEFGWNKIK
ncbi:MAG: DUF2716 domain-containing protein [Oscillospiraceae bacterium]|nr:DUF2716 domain-containing protein [Oscillospiraceae bacterium]